TFEWTWKFAESSFLYGRIESVDRDIFELENKRQRPADVAPDRTAVQAATLGFVRDLKLFSEAETGLGLDATIYRFDRRLDRAYGEHPVSIHGFVRLRFSAGGMGVAVHEHGAI